MSVFWVHKRHSENFPMFEGPRSVGYWSLDEARIIRQDSSQLRYYIPLIDENVKLNLTEGALETTGKPFNFDDEKLEHILRWLQHNYQKIISTNPKSGKWLQPDFICYRGVLSKIIQSPYNYKFGWIVCAVKYRGTIYLCQFDAEYGKQLEANETECDKRKKLMGCKFQQHMLSGSPHEHPDPSKPLNQSEQFYCVFRSRLNNHQLLYAAEMGAVFSQEKMEDPLPLEKLKFIELETCPCREAISTTLRSLRWWCQNYLVGVEDIVCGFKDKYGIVKNIGEVSVGDLEKNAREHFGEKSWNSAIGMNHCDQFLNFIKRTVKENYDQVIYKFERKPCQPIEVTELSPTSEFAFLPKWYTNLTD